MSPYLLMLTRFCGRGAILADQRPTKTGLRWTEVCTAGQNTNKSAAGFSCGAAFVLANVPVPVGISPAYASANLIL
jgi:hypothetical protein